MKTVSSNNIDNAIYEIKSKMYKKYRTGTIICFLLFLIRWRGQPLRF